MGWINSYPIGLGVEYQMYVVFYKRIGHCVLGVPVTPQAGFHDLCTAVSRGYHPCL